MLALLLVGCGGQPATTSEATATNSSGDGSGTATAGESSTTSQTSEATNTGTMGEGTSSETSDSSETGGSDSTAGTTEGSTTIDFVSNPDMGEPGCTSILLEGECPEGQKCMPYANDGGSAWNAVECFDIMGDGMAEEPCSVVDNGVSGMDTCAPGHMCWNVDPETLMGECVAFCKGTTENLYCEQEGYECIAASEPDVLALCLFPCSPILQDCQEGEGCYPANNSYSCAPVSVAEGEGLAGDPCEFINGCQPGLACMQGQLVPDCMSEYCCAPFCELDNPACENPEATCRPVWEQSQVWPNAGFCGVMP